jgi:hypothetical protein
MRLLTAFLLAFSLIFTGLSAEAKKKKTGKGYHKAASYINAGKKERVNKHFKNKKKSVKHKKVSEKRKVASEKNKKHFKKNKKAKI